MAGDMAACEARQSFSLATTVFLISNALVETVEFGN